MILKHNPSPIFLFLLLFIDPAVSSDGETLLKFKASLKNTATLANWDASRPPCRGWKGVLCDKGLVWGLQLENMALQGDIDVETLAKLPDLRSVSFMNNDFEGSLPNLTRLGTLKAIYLSDNKFSGEIPDNAFGGMLSLKKLHLANNKFAGPIPTTLGTIPKLIELMLQDNEFEGQIPNFQQQGLKTFKASNNRLEGQIPQSLSHLHSSSFSGNKELCGAPLQQCLPIKKDSQRKPPSTLIAIAAVLVAAALLAILAVCIFFFFFFFCRKKRSQKTQPRATTSTVTATDLNQMERGRAAVPTSKLTFLKDEEEKFNMQELLRASAEVLGGGVFGSTYKAGLNGKMMVVKRFKHMNKVRKEEFNEHMRRLGRMSHPNVQAIVAFYYRKDEKLLVAEFAQNVSLDARLHGNHQSLDWMRRLKIVKGVARGLVYLQNELPSLTPAHGHLKSSNILLDAAFNPLLCDYGLLPIVNKEQAVQNMIGYKSPEFKSTGKLTKKTDVWSFGMVILEILTRRTSGVVDLATWVKSAVDDGLEVLDKEMAGRNHSQGEMMKLLNIGLSCCQADVDSRPEMKEVVEKVEEIKEKDFEDDFYSTYASESDLRSSRGLSDDFKSLNV